MSEECLICKKPLEYLEYEEIMECEICHKKISSKTRCIDGHFVCDSCHTSNIDSILSICLNTCSKNPIEILEEMMCMPSCPVGCFEKSNEFIYKMDKMKCTQYHVDLFNQHHWPCGYCATFCPVGEDLKMYRDEQAVSEEGIQHCQSFGS